MSGERSFTVESARAAGESGDLDAWVAAFLASDGSDNAELGEQLSTSCTSWLGPVRLPFDELHRLVGPADQPTITRPTPGDMETVEAMEDSLDDGWTPPPFVVTWQGDHLRLEDGNHRVESLRLAGHQDYWCVVGFDGPESRARFEAGPDRPT